MRNLFCGLCLGLPFWAAPPALRGETGPDPFILFATCTGRLSALTEHQWLIQDPASDETQARRDAMAELLASVTAPDRQTHAMDLRLQAKAAAARLLSEARFGQNLARAHWAAGQAARLVAECTNLLIS